MQRTPEEVEESIEKIDTAFKAALQACKDALDLEKTASRLDGAEFVAVACLVSTALFDSALGASLMGGNNNAAKIILGGMESFNTEEKLNRLKELAQGV